MNITLRLEEPTDYNEVEVLIREAFYNVHVPGCSEHYLAHVMRDSKDFVPALDYVALDGDMIVGSILYTTCYILGDDKKQYPVLCFGPISVLPEYQRKGVGTKLIEHTKFLAKDLGYTAILIYGDPAYYERVGFTAAKTYRIGTEYNTYSPALLACELVPGALSQCPGLFYESPIYNVDEEKAAAFDTLFPPKEKVVGLKSQLRFRELSTSGKPRQ